MNDHDRSDRIPLPGIEARCEPGRPCVTRGTCARYQPAFLRGSPLADYSVSLDGGTVLCGGYIRTGSLIKQPLPGRKPHASPEGWR